MPGTLIITAFTSMVIIGLTSSCLYFFLSYSIKRIASHLNKRQLSTGVLSDLLVIFQRTKLTPLLFCTIRIKGC